MGFANLADFRGVDVDVYDLGIRSEFTHLACYSVVESRTENNEQVAFLQAEHRGDGTVHTGHPEILRVLVGQHSTCCQRRNGWRSDGFDDLAQFLLRVRANRTASDIENGAFC